MMNPLEAFEDRSERARQPQRSTERSEKTDDNDTDDGRFVDEDDEGSDNSVQNKEIVSEPQYMRVPQPTTRTAC